MSGLATREQATNNCPCDKQSVYKYKPHNSKDCPTALLIVIANANRIGNCNLLNWNDISVGIIGIRSMRITSPLKSPVKCVASMMLVINFFYWKTCSITKIGLVNILQHDNWHTIKYLLNNKINGISIMKKKFKNKVFRIKRNLLTTGPTKCGLKFINEKKLFKECLSLKLNKKRNIEKRK